MRAKVVMPIKIISRVPIKFQLFKKKISPVLEDRNMSPNLGAVTFQTI